MQKRKRFYIRLGHFLYPERTSLRFSTAESLILIFPTRSLLIAVNTLIFFPKSPNPLSCFIEIPPLVILLSGKSQRLTLASATSKTVNKCITKTLKKNALITQTLQ